VGLVFFEEGRLVLESRGGCPGSRVLDLRWARPMGKVVLVFNYLNHLKRVWGERWYRFQHFIPFKGSIRGYDSSRWLCIDFSNLVFQFFVL